VKALVRLLAALFLTLVPAAAQARLLLPLWTIEDYQPVAPQTVAHDFSGRMFGFRMLPAVMYELSEDVYQDNGRIAAPAGTQLIGLAFVRGGACALFPPKLATGAAIMAWGADRHLCFVDEDQDGSFDKYFFRQDDKQGFFNVFHSMPSELLVPTGGKYAKAEPTAMEGKLEWVVSAQKCKAIDRKSTPRLRCRVSIGLGITKPNGNALGSATLTYGNQFDLFPKTGDNKVDFFGMRLIASDTGSGQITYELSQPQPKAAFILR
jgi:hypothetical protein